MATLKGIFPEPKPIRRKNFLHENVKNLRRMEQCFHANKEVDEMQKIQLQKHQKLGEKYQNVSAKVNSSFRERKHETNAKDLTENKVENGQQELCRKSSAPMLNKNGVSTKKIINLPTTDKSLGKQKRREQKESDKNAQRLGAKVLSDPNVSHKPVKSNNEYLETQTIKYKSQGIQTLDTKEEESIYSEGIIRYPSKKCLKYNVPHNNTEISEQEDGDQKDMTNLPSDRGDIQTSENMYRKSDSRSPELTSPKGEIDFVKLNKERTSIASRMAAQLNSSNLPPTNYRKGVVPKYIRERKEAQEKEQKAKAEASDPDCPEGHVSLPDHERKETLRMLKKNYQDYVNELNMMPIKTDTLRVQKRKMEIEKQLNKLEEGIKVFSRPKVYVKVNA